MKAFKKEEKKISQKEKKFNKILSDIKSIKIQGANNIARAGIEAFLLFPDKTHAKKIISTRSTEPLLQNFIEILLDSSNKSKTAKRLIKYLDNSQDSIDRIGLSLIKKDMNIFSHCHSSSVIEMLKYAKRKGIDFTVYTTEVRPLLQGRKTANELSKLKIPVVLIPDLAAENYIKKCDIFFFGADAYTRRFIFNKIGTSSFVKLASLYNVPSYSIGVSLKYSENVKLEKRPGKEVWDERNSLIDVKYPAFDKFKGRATTGIISELGILSFNKFVKASKLSLKKFKQL
jgi:translation initiation factor 2B subunit (eIF-2B alpha/beta/delta family)